MTSGRSGRPRIVLLHYTAPPIIGGVEAVIAKHAQLFREAGYPTLIVAGRAAEEAPPALGQTAIIPEMDSENPEYLEIHHELLSGRVPQQFGAMRSRIERGMELVITPDDVVIAHNVLTTHFNLALTSAIHRAVEKQKLTHLIVWCHDISRHVNPLRNVVQYHHWPWDLLRAWIPGASYVAVSVERQETLAGILDSPPRLIEVVPNGVDPGQLLGLSRLGKHLAAVHGFLSVDLVMLMPVRITRAKNIEFAVRVVDALRRRGISVRLVVTGPPDPHVADSAGYFEDLRHLRETLGLQREVVFVHEGTDEYPAPLNIDASVVAELYRVTDIVLMPSVREGFGMPVFEAGLMGRPIFATDIPATRMVPGFQHLIGKEEEPEAVANRIATWAASDAGHALRSQIRREFTWSQIFESKIIPLVTEVAGAPRGVQE